MRNHAYALGEMQALPGCRIYIAFLSPAAVKQLYKFLQRCQKVYESILMGPTHNIQSEQVVESLGFAKTTEVLPTGILANGWRWTRPKPAVVGYCETIL